VGHNSGSRERGNRERQRRADKQAANKADAKAAVESFNASLRTCAPVWAIPTVGAALTSRHHWLTLLCESCNQLSDVDLTFKERPRTMPITRAAVGIVCSRCGPHGRQRIMGLFREPGFSLPKRERRQRETPPSFTIGETMKSSRGGWMWVYCTSHINYCNYSERLTFAAWAILYGLDTPIDFIRKNWQCPSCGGRGGQLNRGHDSWPEPDGR
jgi:hypothetical protein